MRRDKKLGISACRYFCLKYGRYFKVMPHPISEGFFYFKGFYRTNYGRMKIKRRTIRWYRHERFQ